MMIERCALPGVFTMLRLLFARSSCAAVATMASFATLIGGCAVGPDFHRPAPPTVNRYLPEPLIEHTESADSQVGESQHFIANGDLPAEWWTLFHSPDINALVDQALKNNPTVSAAQAALRVAMETMYAQQGAYFPSVQASGSVVRQRNAAATVAPTLTSGAPIFNLYTPQVNVSYLFDVFGVNRRQVESLAAVAESQRFQLEATYLTLTSNVVAAAVQEASIRAQLAGTEDIVRFQREQVGVMQELLVLGSIAESDLIAQQAALAQTEAALPSLLKQLAQQRNSLAALTGRFPSDSIDATFEFGSLQLPQELPVSVPSKLIEQRPDIRAAEAQLHAASAQVGVAIGNLLPQITLTAGLGSAATTINELFIAGNNFWSAGVSLTQTLFAGGTLVHRKRAAEAALDQAAAQYRSTVIAAFQNVADTLRALEYDARAVAAQQRAKTLAAHSLEIARHQVQLGSTSYLSLLSAELIYQQSLINLAQAQASQYADTVALFQSLGGGWWNRTSTHIAASAATGQ